MTRMTGPDSVVMCNLINKYIHTYIHTYRMTRMTGPDCVVMCNLINTYIHTYIHAYIHTYIHIIHSNIASTPAAFPAGVDPNRESEETVRSQGVGGALLVESTSQTVRTNVYGTKTGVPPRKAGGRRGACE